MIKHYILIVCISIFFCHTSKADLFDLYDLDQIRTTLPDFIQTMIARYVLASINTDFMLKLPKKFEWKLTTSYKIEQSLAHFLEPGLPPKQPYKESMSATRFSQKFYLVRPVNFPHKIIVQYQEHSLVSKPKFTLEYPEDTVFNAYWLDHATMQIHVIVGNEEHIWQAYVTVYNQEYTWHESVTLESYLPHKTVTLEQALFLMLIELLYTTKGDVDLAYLAYTCKDTLGKHLATNSLQAIVNYLDTVLKSFGPIIEPLITRHFNISIKDSPLHTYAKKTGKRCVSQ